MKQNPLCDGCKKECPDNYIYLKGYKGFRHGSILLPERCLEFDFCGDFCFEEWFKEGLKQENPDG